MKHVTCMSLFPIDIGNILAFRRLLMGHIFMFNMRLHAFKLYLHATLLKRTLSVGR